MFNNLSKREKTMLWMALAVLLLGLYYFQLLGPLLAEKAAMQEETGSLRQQYRVKLAAIQNQFPAVRQNLADIAVEYERLAQGFPKEAEVSKLLFQMEETASARGIKLERFAPKTLNDRGDFYELPVQLSFFSNYAQMVSFVHALETSEKRMRVITLDVKKSLDPARPELQADITVSIFIAKEQT